MKRLKLKRKWVVIITIILTLLSIEVIKTVATRIEQIKKIAEQCDISKGSTCSSYELRQYSINE